MKKRRAESRQVGALPRLDWMAYQLREDEADTFALPWLYTFTGSMEIERAPTRSLGFHFPMARLDAIILNPRPEALAYQTGDSLTASEQGF